MSDRSEKYWEKLCAANREIGSTRMELIETLRRLAAAWERLRRPEAAKDAIRRADEMMARFQRGVR